MESSSGYRFPPIELPSGGVVELHRCDDRFAYKASELSMPIELRGWRLMALSHRLGLPQIYAALTALTGPSGELYDDWKGAFSFSFKVTVRRGDREFRYLLLLMNFRSWVKPSLYRVQRPGESYDRSRFHAPFDDEFSEADITYVFNFIEGFLGGYLETMPRWTTPFVKEVKSNLILFGYDPKAGDFFEESYEEEDAYEAALERWRTLVPPEPSVLEEW